MTRTIHDGDHSPLAHEDLARLGVEELAGCVRQLDEALDALIREAHNPTIVMRALATLNYVRGRIDGGLA